MQFYNTRFHLLADLVSLYHKIGNKKDAADVLEHCRKHYQEMELLSLFYQYDA